MYAGFLLKFRTKCYTLNPKLGDYVYRIFSSKLRAKCYVYALNPKLGDYVCRIFGSSSALSATRLTRNSGTMYAGFSAQLPR
jgi:hypothetical protein